MTSELQTMDQDLIENVNIKTVCESIIEKSWNKFIMERMTLYMNP